MNNQSVDILKDTRYLMDLINANSQLPTKLHGQSLNVAFIETSLGAMLAGATQKGICMLEFPDYKHLQMELEQLVDTFRMPLVESESVYFDTLRTQLDLYFEGKLKIFDIPLDMVGTDFQKKVWTGLLQIPYGTTSTYAKQAQVLEMSSAVRAVANANGKNKISIIIPCHRVIGADGSLTGYGGGLWRKKRLLELERGNMPSQSLDLFSDMK